MIATAASKQFSTQPDRDGDEVDDFAPELAARQPIELKLSAGDAGERLDKTLAKHVAQFSRSRIQQWIEAGFVTLDGKPAQVKMTVYGGEYVVILPQAAPEDAAFQPEPMALSITHEDEQLIVIDKQAGLVVHPAAGNWSGTLLNGLLHHFPPIAGVPRAGIVHRLDKDTSGLLVVAKTLEAQTDLVRQLQARTMHREYLALVWGAPHLKGKVDAALGRHPRDRLKMAVLESASAKPAVTHFERLAEGTLERHRVNLIRCKLETGRTHQIRVHLQSIGHPLVGDTIYGKQHLAHFFQRQALHASRLGLIHPQTGQECAWHAPLPDDFAGLLKQAGIEPPSV